MSSNQKLESIQYRACLTITGAMRGTSKGKLYQESGLESLHIRYWNRKLGLFYKIFKSKLSPYLKKTSHMLKEMQKLCLFLISGTTSLRILSVDKNRVSNLDSNLRNSENVWYFKE